jgi:flagellin-like hook-associated protein FlgL
MAEVTLSKAVRSNLLNLQSTAAQLGKTQERLATGLKVNSALDNPTNFFTASSLNSRAGDLGRLLDAVGNATQTIEAANNGLSSITKLVESAQATARQALQTTGAVTSNEVVGDSSATFNPAAFTTVSGDNDTTGTSAGAIAADTAANLDVFDLAADATNIADYGGDGDISGAGASGTALSAATTTLANGNTISFAVNGVDYTINFDAGTAVGDTQHGDATNGYTTTLGVDQGIDDLATQLTTLLAGSGVSVADDGDGSVTYSFSSAVDTVHVTDSAGDGSLIGAVGIVGAGTADANAGDGSRVIGRNADFEAYLAASGSGNTVAVGFGGTTVGTLTLGEGNITTKAGLVSALNGFSGLTATDGGDGNAITVTAADSNDADSSITFTSSIAAAHTFVNADVSSAYDSTNALVDTATGVNLLTQSKVSQGDTLTAKVGSSATLTVTFGTGSGQVSTLGELNSKLAELAGGAASANTRGEVNITSDNAGDPVTIGGTTAALSSFGLTAGETSSLIDGTNISSGDTLSIQVGTNAQQTITFGTGTGQVNTLSELETALSNVAGGTATIDGSTGAITIEATNGSDAITVTGSDSGTTDAVAASFGLSSGTQTATTTDSTSRATLETQYNDLLTQINQLSDDASFNGVNLLGGNDLNVIFNEDSSSKLDIKGVTFNSSGLGLSRVSSGSFQTDTNINNVLDSLDTAISSLRSQATTFGSNLSVVETRQDFTKTMINTLQTGASNLTLADTNEEAANLLALQTRQQLSTTALSLANQAGQNVLRLF